ncbi:hypothetical protein TAFFO16_283 [Bacillus phage Taffo16]|uniref:Uncharacterized protein n=1 Tax=Bacillus phage Taffo16 TaxID=2030094 RepID=A0A249XX04_9CAUD|nr:hypothetical protein TAFFO16_283 [Bacillus phage Taffo16]ULF48909.1 hypothetical protein [Bacillus phage BillyBob]
MLSNIAIEEKFKQEHVRGILERIYNKSKRELLLYIKELEQYYTKEEIKHVLGVIKEVLRY